MYDDLDANKIEEGLNYVLVTTLQDQCARCVGWVTGPGSELVVLVYPPEGPDDSRTVKVEARYFPSDTSETLTIPFGYHAANRLSVADFSKVSRTILRSFLKQAV